jgi:hypothetical protein
MNLIKIWSYLKIIENRKKLEWIVLFFRSFFENLYFLNRINQYLSLQGVFAYADFKKPSKPQKTLKRSFPYVITFLILQNKGFPLQPREMLKFWLFWLIYFFSPMKIEKVNFRLVTRSVERFWEKNFFDFSK